MRRTPTLIVTLTLLLITHPLLAWNNTGHITVALLAWRQLNDAQKQQIGALLKHHPHYEKFLIADLPEGIDESQWAFMRAATWPDWVRPPYPGMPGKPQDLAVTRKYHKPNLHYINLYFIPPDDVGKVSESNPGVAPVREEPNVLTAIDNAMKELGDTKTPDEEKAIQLCWLLHCIGDLHQPLHTCTMLSSKYPEGDRGGNEQSVRAGARVTRLHAYWDECLGTAEEYPALAFIADQTQTAFELDPQHTAKLQKNTTLESWMNESHQMAIAMAYLGGRLPTTQTADVEKTKKAMPGDVPALPVGYEFNAHALAQQRVALAGYRLAAKLAEIFK